MWLDVYGIYLHLLIMKILSAPQIKAADEHTIHSLPISSVDLMERAAARCTDWLTANYPKETLFVVLCGSGNNGGDGLAITRMLHRHGYGVKAFLLPTSAELSRDCSSNLNRLQRISAGLVENLQQDTYITDIAEHIVIIDAILGTGLSRPAEGWVAKFIDKINELPNKVISIDMPSGLPADSLPGEKSSVISAVDTLSFQFYKRSFLHGEGGKYCGRIHILDIGLDETFARNTVTHYNIITKDEVLKHYKPRQPFSHKGTYGMAFLIGGSYGMMGAIALAGKAALRTGAGKVRVLLPEAGYDIIQTLVPECMCITKGQHHINNISEWENADAIGIGCGIGTEDNTIAAFCSFIEAVKEPVVIDADALNIIAKHPELLHKIPAGSILTPHPKEFERLFGPTSDSMQRAELARMQAMRYGFNIVLKDRYTIVIDPEGECWYNLTGNAGLATAGSGDVLTGIITGLLAQGYAPTIAAMLGIYLHGKAGEYASNIHSQESMVAGDIVESLGAAYRSL
jgi:NAD(P)H-hydrate epimerase